MNYTDAEIKTMQNNLRQIEDFIRTEILPFTREFFQVEWGGRYLGPRSFDDAPMYHIGIYPEKQYAAFGEKYGGNHNFIMSEEELKRRVDAKEYPFSGSCYGSYSIYTLPDKMQVIISNWRTIKSQMINKVAEQKQKISDINNFQI